MAANMVLSFPATMFAKHPPGIVVEIVGTEMGDQGRSCEEHAVCGSMVLEEDVVVHLRKVQVLVEGQEETVIACIWATNGIDCCCIGFLQCHMVHHAARYDGALAQVTKVLNGNEDECSREEHQIFHAKRGCCQATIISCLPEVITMEKWKKTMKQEAEVVKGKKEKGD